MSRLHLKQIAQNNATDQQLIRYNATSGFWEVSDSDGIAVPYRFDKAEAPSVTSGNYSSTGLTVGTDPAGDSHVSVIVNGIKYSVGDGYRGTDCYFSDDGGTTAKSMDDIAEGDELYWNGDIAKFELSASDKVDLDYNVSGTTIFGKKILIERKLVTSNQSSVTFSNLDGYNDGTYYITYYLKDNSSGPGATTTILQLLPNGSSADAAAVYKRFSSNQDDSTSSMAVGVFERHVDCHVFGEAYFYANQSIYRYCDAACLAYVSGSFHYGYVISSKWEDDSNNVTSIEISGEGVGATIGIGSEISLYKIVQE